jgi:hypothetical protein
VGLHDLSKKVVCGTRIECEFDVVFLELRVRQSSIKRNFGKHQHHGGSINIASRKREESLGRSLGTLYGGPIRHLTEGYARISGDPRVSLSLETCSLRVIGPATNLSLARTSLDAVLTRREFVPGECGGARKLREECLSGGVALEVQLGSTQPARDGVDCELRRLESQ